MSADESRRVIADFKQAVNMTPKALAAWLDTPESKQVGFKSTEGGESVGHQSGKKIIMLLGKPNADFTGDDLAHARKVVGGVQFTAIWRNGRLGTCLAGLFAAF